MPRDRIELPTRGLSDQIFKNSNTGIFIANREGNLTTYNKAFADIIGLQDLAAKDLNIKAKDNIEAVQQVAINIEETSNDLYQEMLLNLCHSICPLLLFSMK